jgi:hypothetical protein
MLRTDVPWIGWAASNDQVPASLIVGSIVTVAALVAIRPLRWT